MGGRWELEAPTSYWYPNMRLVRQQVRGDWAPVVETTKATLAAMAGAQGAQ